MLALLVLADASAATFNVRFCAEVNVDLVDAAVGDRWTTDGEAKPLRGFLYSVWEKRPGVPEALFSSGDLLESGSNVGCTPVINNLSDAFRYRFTVFTTANVAGNSVWVFDVVGLYQSLDLYAAYVPTFTGTQVAPAVDGAAHPRFNQIAIAAFALFMHDGGEDASYEIIEGTCCSWTASTGTSTITVDTSVNSKTLLAHLIGHEVAYQVDYDGAAHGGVPLRNDGSAMDSCDGDESSSDYGTLTKEWHSTAASEGIADFYAAITWNDTTESSCELAKPYPIDWDNDGTNDLDAWLPYTCEGDPNGGTDYVTSKDWLQDLIAANDSGGCDGTDWNRSTAYDWSRFWWDIIDDGDGNGHPVSIANVWALWDEADPFDWDTDGTTGTVVDDPPPRIGQAFIDLDPCSGTPPCYLEDAFYAQIPNGQDH